jgi:hypothetical protein
MDCSKFIAGKILYTNTVGSGFKITLCYFGGEITHTFCTHLCKFTLLNKLLEVFIFNIPYESHS